MNSQLTCDPPPETVTTTCPTHGEYEARIFRMSFVDAEPFKSNCPQCLRERQERADAEAKEEAARRERQHIEALFHRSGIPARLKSSFEDPLVSSWMLLPASSSMCMRLILILRVCSPAVTSKKPLRQIGVVCWDIW